MISQADGARLMAAAAKWVLTTAACAEEGLSAESTHKVRQRLIAADKAAEAAFAELVSKLTEPE